MTEKRDDFFSSREATPGDFWVVTAMDEDDQRLYRHPHATVASGTLVSSGM